MPRLPAHTYIEFTDDQIRKFWSLVDKGEGPDACWEWRETLRDGYGRFNFRDATKWRMTVAHRASYIINVGEIPEGMQLDHLCRNRGCVNPDHLEAVTQHVNMQRAPRAASETCIHGHQWSENAIYRSGGPKRPSRRYCRTCMQERGRAKYLRLLAAAS